MSFLKLKVLNFEILFSIRKQIFRKVFSKNKSIIDIYQGLSEICNIHRKTPVLESLLNKVAGLRWSVLQK